MVTGQQIRRLRQKLMEGKTQEAVAAAAGMSVRTARSWQHGPLPWEGRTSRAWRTRPDSFASIWSEAVEPLLQRDRERVLQATTVLEWLEERYPGTVQPGPTPDSTTAPPGLACLAWPGTGGVLSAGTSTEPGSPTGFHRRRRVASHHRRPALYPPILRVHPQPLGVAVGGPGLRRDL